MKKLRLYILQVLLIFFLIFLFSAKNYYLEYSINDVKITEEYIKNKKAYYFTFNYKDQVFDYLIESKYKIDRSLIEDVQVIENDESVCLKPKSKLNILPVCSNNSQNVYYTLNTTLKDDLEIKDKEDNLLEVYNDIKIYNRDYKYLIWSYDGFYYINAKSKEKIDLFEHENYTINLIGYTKDYIVVADYDKSYTFDKFYVINFKNGNVKSYELNRNIYFDSYYAGYLANKLYIVDKKEQLMYEFNAKNGKLNKIKTRIYNVDKWEDANIKTLINKNVYFNYNTNYNYSLIDGELYLNYLDKEIKTLIATDVKWIVKTDNQDIFYLKEDSLYHFNVEDGEELLLNYFEWNFNYQNAIYIN